MFTKEYKSEIELKRENIDALSKGIGKFLKEYKVFNKDIISTRISIEDVLLKFLEEGYSKAFLECVCKFGKAQIRLVIDGLPLNPFKSESEDDNFTDRIISNYKKIPVWKYTQKTNNILYYLSKEKGAISSVMPIIIAVMLGLLLGICSKAFGTSFAKGLLKGYISPLSNSIMKLLVGTASFLIFTSVIFGICGMGDIATFNTRGKKIISLYIKPLIRIMALTLVVCIPFFEFVIKGGGKFSFAPIWKLFLSIIPPNLIEPFITGNMLQVIFLAFCFGIVLLLSGDKTDIVKKFIVQLEYITGKIIQVICKFIPLIVFKCIVGMFLNDKMSFAKGIYKPIIIFLAITIVLVLYNIWRAGKNSDMSLKNSLKTISQLFVIVFTTASSIAAFDTTMKTGKKYGIADETLKFGIPLGQVIYKPDVEIALFVFALYFAQISNMQITIVFVIKAFITAILLSIATPPIPGGGYMVYIAMITTMGIPKECVAILMMLDVLFDHVGTTSNIISVVCKLTNMKKINEKAKTA